jgi:hypothetical protein
MRCPNFLTFLLGVVGFFLLDTFRMYRELFAPKAAHAAAPRPGTRKILYAWAVDLVNPGPGQDATAEVGGYKLDVAVAAGSYPDADLGAYIPSQGAAVSQCMSALRRLQSRGSDARGRIYYKIFGQDATDPVRPLAAGEDDETEVMRVDVPERSVQKKVNAANRNKDAGLNIGDDHLPQDLDNPVGG